MKKKKREYLARLKFFVAETINFANFASNLRDFITSFTMLLPTKRR